MASRLKNVLDPVIPTVAEWISQSPGTISLGQGVAYFPPPKEIFDIVSNPEKYNQAHLYGPCFGLPDLIDTIHRKLQSDNHINIVHEDNFVMVTAGSNMAFSHVVQAIGDPGVEIILPSPFYFNHHMAITLAGMNPMTTAVRSNFQLDIEAIESSITPKTKAIVTVSPNNPTGAVYPKSDILRINNLCRRHNIFHISDEAYEYFTFDKNDHFSPGASQSATEHTISLFSLSKSYGFAGWRIGYLVAPSRLKQALQKIQDTHLISPPFITQIAAKKAIDIGKNYPARHHAEIEKTRNLFLDIFNQNAHICDSPISQGAFYLLVKFKTDFTPEELSKTLIDKNKIAALPATTFGLTKDTFLRFSFGAIAPHLRDVAANQLNDALNAIQN